MQMHHTYNPSTSKPGRLGRIIGIGYALGLLMTGGVMWALNGYDILSGAVAGGLFGLFSMTLGFTGFSIMTRNLKREEAKRKQLQDSFSKLNAELEFIIEDRTRDLEVVVQRLKSTNRSACIGYWSYELANQKLIWSDIAREIHEVAEGFEPDSESAMAFYKGDAERQTVLEAVDDVVGSGGSSELEFEIVTAKGNLKWVHVIVFAEYDGKGNCVSVLGTIQDINTRKLAEIKLHQDQVFLQQVIDAIPVNVYVKDLNSRKVLINDKELKMMGVAHKSEVIGKTDYELFPQSSAYKSQVEDQQVFKTGLPFHSEETRMDLKDGRTEWFISSKTPHKDHSGNIVGLIGVSVNITERKKLEENLKKYAILEARALEMEQLAYIASHDLKEPLLTVGAYIREYFEVYGNQQDEEALHFQQIIERGMDRMQKMIDGLLNYSRTSVKEDLQAVALDELLREVREDLADLMVRSNAVVEVAEALPVVRCYPEKLKALFLNLVTNAIKYQDKPIPVIRITMADKPHYWLFCVEDNGIGISEKYYDQIFAMFKRLHSRHEYEGTGIGLAQCQKLVEIHSGKIWVESELTKGSKFYFTIPKDL